MMARSLEWLSGKCRLQSRAARIAIDIVCSMGMPAAVSSGRNERPKSDHRHVDGVEELYRFTTPEDLIREFVAEVTRRRKQ
jgi:hypothetical protein